MRNTILGVMLAVWTVNFAAGLIPALHYTPNQVITGSALAIFGVVLGLGPRDADKGKGGG